MNWRGLVCCGLLLGSYKAAFPAGRFEFAPHSWAVCSVALWLIYVMSRGWSRMGKWDQRHFVWGLFSAVIFMDYLHFDKEFKGWSDAYFFCGSRLQYCTCDFKWNLNGWTKATILWNFVLSSALGLQKLTIQMGLDGLLPGEEVVTKESFISICWRLIPYWLNNWEQQWGAECSSMMFELPHFAVELLVVLPCVQIICARLKILAMPQLRVMLPENGNDARHAEAEQRENLAPNILKGFWEVDPAQRRIMPRLKANMRIMFVTACIAGLAAFNALVVPLQLERQIGRHPRTPLVQAGAQQELLLAPGIPDPGTQFFMDMTGQSGFTVDRGVRAAVAATEWGPQLLGLADAYTAKGCLRPERLLQNLRKHVEEIAKMQDPEHEALIPLVEAALAVMRLSCEKFFVLVSVYAAYLLVRDPPPTLRTLIRFNACLSMLFQKLILYSFPAICWIYGAGIIFSAFVSVVFWGGPAVKAYEAIRAAGTRVRPKDLAPATREHLERMGGNCAICWGDMAVPGEAAPPGGGERASPAKALPCGHAYHEICLIQWLHQCHSQGRPPTCPMCQGTIALEVKYQFPLPWRRRGELAGPAEPALEPLLDDRQQLQREFQALIEDMDAIPVPEFDAQPAVPGMVAHLEPAVPPVPAPIPRMPPPQQQQQQAPHQAPPVAAPPPAPAQAAANPAPTAALFANPTPAAAAAARAARPAEWTPAPPTAVEAGIARPVTPTRAVPSEIVPADSPEQRQQILAAAAERRAQAARGSAAGRGSERGNHALRDQGFRPGPAPGQLAGTGERPSEPQARQPEAGEGARRRGRPSRDEADNVPWKREWDDRAPWAQPQGQQTFLQLPQLGGNPAGGNGTPVAGFAAAPFPPWPQQRPGEQGSSSRGDEGFMSPEDQERRRQEMLSSLARRKLLEESQRLWATEEEAKGEGESRGEVLQGEEDEELHRQQVREENQRRWAGMSREELMAELLGRDEQASASATATAGASASQFSLKGKAATVGSAGASDGAGPSGSESPCVVAKPESLSQSAATAWEETGNAAAGSVDAASGEQPFEDALESPTVHTRGHHSLGAVARPKPPSGLPECAELEASTSRGGGVEVGGAEVGRMSGRIVGPAPGSAELLTEMEAASESEASTPPRGQALRESDSESQPSRWSAFKAKIGAKAKRGPGGQEAQRHSATAPSAALMGDPI